MAGKQDRRTRLEREGGTGAIRVAFGACGEGMETGEMGARWEEG